MKYLDYLDETSELALIFVNKLDCPKTIIKKIMEIQKDKADYIYVKYFVDFLFKEKTKIIEDNQFFLNNCQFGC